MEKLKYNFDDYKKMVDVFATIVDNSTTKEEDLKELEKLLDYPTHVIKAFWECMFEIKDKGEDYVKDNFWGIAAWVVLRMNFAKPIEQDW